MTTQLPGDSNPMWVWTGTASACGPRTENQDRVHADAQTLAVFDGVSGRPLGGMAAAVGLGHAIATAAGSRARGSADVEGALRAAGEAVHEMNRRVGLNSATTGTIVAIYSVNGSEQAMVGWVGDTSAFLVRGGGILRLTQPHVKRNQETGSPISRWLGDLSSGTPDTHKVLIGDGDRLVVASDGVTDVMSDAAIGGIIAGATSPQGAADDLVAAAFALGTKDNSTVAVAFLSFDPHGAPAATGPVAPAAAELGVQSTEADHRADPVRAPAVTDTIQE